MAFDLDDEELKATRMMNGADRKGRVNKMEQDIKDIELFIDFCRAPYNFEHESEEKSYKELSYKIEHLIKAYKELEEERQIVGMSVRNKRDGRIGIVLHQWKSGSVAVLESINPRVINTHDSWNTLEIVTDEVKQTQTKCETIPVSLVEEKIEDFRDKTVWGYNDWKYDENVYKAELNIIDKLEEELLEKRK